MATKTYNAPVQNKRDTTVHWPKNAPVLLDGEIVIVDTAAGEIRYKVGDGTKKYSQLPFTDEAMLTLISSKADAVPYSLVKNADNSLSLVWED